MNCYYCYTVNNKSYVGGMFDASSITFAHGQKLISPYTRKVGTKLIEEANKSGALEHYSYVSLRTLSSTKQPHAYLKPEGHCSKVHH